METQGTSQNGEAWSPTTASHDIVSEQIYDNMPQFVAGKKEECRNAFTVLEVKPVFCFFNHMWQ